jgi:Large polyvalent protein associated domain 38
LFGVRQNFLNTMIHEIAHTGDMDHGVGHNNQMMRVEQYLADQGLLDYFRDAIMDILARHESTFTAMKEEYEKSTTANIAKSLEDINKGAKSARGDDSGGGNKVSQLSARTGQGRNEPVRPSAEDAEEEYDRRQEYLDQREADGRGDFKLKHSPSVKDFLLGSYKTAKAAAKAVKENPMLAVNKMTSKLDRAVTYARIKGIWYGRGLEVEEVKRYNGQVRDGQEKAISTVALTNALHSGEIMAQVIMRGNLVFDTESQMFRAEDAKESMANVMLAKHDLIERVGAQEANNMIQDYFEAKRSRSILDSFVDQEAAVEKAKEKAEKIEFGTESYYDALDEVEKAKRDFYNIAIARSKVSLSDESIDIYSALEDDNPELRIMMDNWQAVNKNIIDNMEFSGLISKKRAKQLRDIKDYVPWQRIQDDMEDVHSPQGRSSTKSLTNVAKEKVFKRNAAVNKAAREYIDGEIDIDQFNEVMQQHQENLGEIDDILDNMLHNVAILGRNSMRNHAANMIAQRYAERYTEGKKKDKLRLFREEGKDENGVRVNIVINGRRVIVNIQDPLIAEAVLGMENINMPAVQVFAVMANLLRRGITTWPQFQLRQLFMDAPTAAMVSGLGAKNSAILYADTFKSFLNALNSEDPIVRHLQAYGIGGFQSYTRSPEKLYKQKIGLVEHNKLDQFTNLLDKVGDASDMAQRIATYKRVLAETGDETLALIRANNIIDFKKHGNSKIAVALTRSVSFMNAYAQQLDVLAEALAGGGLKGKNRGAAFASMLKAASMLTMWTVIYTMIMGGNDDYENMDDQKKARNFVIPKKLTKAIGLEDNVLLPMNTSPSFFFKAMPELITNYVLKKGTKNEVDGTRLRKALSDAFVDSMLGPNPIPTGIKPFAEIGLNHNFFTGGTITPKGMEGLDAAEQYNASVSELGKVISALTGRALNPFEADHLVRGIFGTNGALVMWGSNLFSGERPTAEQKDNPLWGGLLDRDVGRNKEALFYDLKNEVEPKHKTFMKMVEREKDVEADKYFDKHEKELEVYEYVKGIEAALKEVNKEIRRVGEVKDPKLTKDDRRKEILELQNTKNEILEDVIEMRKAAGL